MRVCILHPWHPSLFTDIARKPSLYRTLSFKSQTSCISETKNLLAAGIFNTVTDFIVVILLMSIVRKLQLSLQQQIIVVLLFSAGLVVTMVGVVRTYYLYQVTIVYDKTWTVFPAWVTSSVELYVGIVSRPRILSSFILTNADLCFTSCD